MTQIGQDTLKTRRTLTAGGKAYEYFSIPEAQKSIGDAVRSSERGNASHIRRN